MERMSTSWRVAAPDALTVGVYSRSAIFLAAAAKWLGDEEDLTLVVCDEDPGPRPPARRHDVVVLDGQLLPLVLARHAAVARAVVVARPGQTMPVVSMLGAGVRGVVLAESCTGRVLAAAVRAAAVGHLFVQNDVVDRVGDPDPGRAELRCLTDREHQVWRLLATGRSNRQLAAALQISERTVRFHLTNIFQKIGARSRGEAIGLAYRIAAS